MAKPTGLSLHGRGRFLYPSHRGGRNSINTCSSTWLKASLASLLAFACLAGSISLLAAGIRLSGITAWAIATLMTSFGVGVARMLAPESFGRRKILPPAEGLDSFTGLPNRQAFIAAGSKLIEDTDAGTIGLVLCEVRGLGELNECCGRLTGDDVLRLVAHQLVTAAKENGAVFRIAGDRFAVIVNRGNGDRLAKIVLAVRTFEFEFSTLAHTHKIRLPAGFASLEAGEGFSSLVKRTTVRLHENEAPVKAGLSNESTEASWPDSKLSTGQLALPKSRTLRLLGTADD
jgi:diguanylate cyclase (GGDEF)-like protein